MKLLVDRRRHQRGARRGGHARARASPTATAARCCPSSPAPGLVEFDAAELADGRAGRRPRGRGRRRRRRRRRHRQPAGLHHRVGPGHRRAGRARRWAGRTCAPSATASMLAGQGFRMAPNLAATKAAHLLDAGRPRRHPGPVRRHRRLLGGLDPVAGAPSTSPTPATPPSTACGPSDQTDWDDAVLDALQHPRSAACPTVVDSIGVVGAGHRPDGAPPIAGILGDQQASLLGQGCVRPGQAKITFGTGGMLDLCLDEPPVVRHPGRRRHLPHRHPQRRTASAAGASRRSCSPPAPTSSGCATTSASSTTPPTPTPWPPAARPATAWPTCPPCSAWAPPPGTTAPAAPCSASPGAAAGPQIVRAVLEGVAQRAADLVDGGRDRRRPRHPDAARRRRHVRQPHVRPGPGRRHRPPGRGLARAGGHHPGRRLRRRAGHRRLARRRRRSPPPGSPPRWSSRSARSTGRRWADTLRRAETWFPDLSAISF